MSKGQAKSGGKASLFKPGQSGNPAGKPKGVPNKITSQMRETFTDIFNNNKDKIQGDIDKLEPKDRVKFWVELMPYFLPRLTATKAELTVRHTGYEHLEDKRLTDLILSLNITEDGESTDAE
jgi:hypothetical protein